jgi:hypothetical protein
MKIAPARNFGKYAGNGLKTGVEEGVRPAKSGVRPADGAVRGASGGGQKGVGPV